MTIETKNNAPSHYVYRVDGQGQQAKWIKVGAVFPAKGGYTQVLNSYDKDLRFVLQEVKNPEGEEEPLGIIINGREY